MFELTVLFGEQTLVASDGRLEMPFFLGESLLQGFDLVRTRSSVAVDRNGSRGRSFGCRVLSPSAGIALVLLSIPLPATLTRNTFDRKVGCHWTAFVDGEGATKACVSRTSCSSKPDLPDPSVTDRPSGKDRIDPVAEISSLRAREVSSE